MRMTENSSVLINKMTESNNDLQKTTQKTKDWATRTPLKTGGELGCSGRVSSSWSTSGTRRDTVMTGEPGGWNHCPSHIDIKPNYFCCKCSFFVTVQSKWCLGVLAFNATFSNMSWWWSVLLIHEKDILEEKQLFYLSRFCVLCPTLPVSLKCPSVFSNVYFLTKINKLHMFLA
jgi:hypothetical protein